MKIVAVSDLHGFLPNTPESDLLLVAGDICPATNHNVDFQQKWLKNTFEPWLQKQPTKTIIGVWGNHDLIGERPNRIPKLSWKLLQDSATEVEGLKIWGTPWQRRFFDWAFNLDEDELAAKYELMPSDMDIVVSHGPPYGHGDLAPPYPPRTKPEHTGSRRFMELIAANQPKLVVFGHIHPARGLYKIGNSVVANVTHVNEAYQPVHKPMVFNLEDGKITNSDFG